MNIPETLRQRLRAGKVIPFVGAGVSMAVRESDGGAPLFPSWREMLNKAAERLEAEKHDDYAALVRNFLTLKTPDYLQSARYAREGMGAAIWFEFLKEQIDKPLESASPESLDLARAVWNLGSKLVVTTNFDRVLHWASPQRGGPASWDIAAHAELAAMLRDGLPNPTIWHLHGQIHNAAKLILTSESFSLLYSDTKAADTEKPYRAALQTLRSLLASHSFLFIGFSLDDVFFRHQLDEVNQIYEGGEGPHYVLMREADIAYGLRDEKAVKAVPFSEFGEPLLKLVQELGEIAARPEPSFATGSSSQAEEKRAPVVADYDPRHTPFFVPFRQKGAQVIGREAALQAVREQLTSGRRTAIGQTASFQGLGGLGKTQLAVEFAYRFRDAYPNGVVWLNADQDIDAQLTELAEKARWVSPHSEHKYKLEIARQRLRTYSDCLIIFDNLEDPQAIQDYLPEPQADPHILVTSRIDQPGFTPIPLDPLNEALSIELLYQEAGRKPEGEAETDAAREIALSLGGLPLALELAGAYLQYRPISFQQYLELLRQNLKAATAIKFTGGGFTRHETDLYSTLKIDEEVFEEEPRLRDILDLLTWSGTAPMGLSLMCRLLGVENPVELTGALGLGTLLRMLQKIPDADSYSIHRLLSEVRREEIQLDTRLDWVNNVCKRMGDWFQERREDFSNLPALEAEIDHLKSWQEHAVKYAPEHISRLIWLEAYPPSHRGRYQESKELVESAVLLFEQRQERDEELKAHFLDDLGVCYRALGNFNLALTYHEKALTIRSKLFGELHPDTTTTLSQICDAYYSLGDYKKSLEYAERALKIRKELFGVKHPDTASSLNDIGRVELRLGNNNRALEYCQKALNIRLELLGENARYTGSSYSSLGDTYSVIGDYNSAVEYAEKALKIDLEVLGEQHPDTATAISNMGVAYGNLKNYEEGLKCAEKALQTRQDLLGERHPATAYSFNQIGQLYRGLGELKRALELLDKALELRKEVLGGQHPDTIGSAVSKADVLAGLGRPLQAYYLLDELFRKLPKDHPSYDWLRQQHLTVKNLCPGLRHSTAHGQGPHKKRRKKR